MTGLEKAPGQEGEEINRPPLPPSSQSEPCCPPKMKGYQCEDIAPRPNKAQILPRLRMKHQRLRTFQNWPITKPTADELATAGFFYYNDQDRVQCAFCLGIIGQWEVTDNPLEEHARLLPQCEFIGEMPKLTEAYAPRFPTSSFPIAKREPKMTSIQERPTGNAEPERGWEYMKQQEIKRLEAQGIQVQISNQAIEGPDTPIGLFHSFPRGYHIHITRN